jgi:ankyrin repeat protein
VPVGGPAQHCYELDDPDATPRHRISRIAYDRSVIDGQTLVELIRAIGMGDRRRAEQLLDAEPQLATQALGEPPGTTPTPEFFVESLAVQIYTGHTALHVAATAHDIAIARLLVAAGAGVRARNRRGAEPIHAATDDEPGSARWNPEAQAAMIVYLIEAGADPQARAAGGVTPLHRAVRNRCAAAVRVLLDAGADPHQTNDRGSSAVTLARWTTGRSGSGFPDAQAEQATIVELLQRAL